MSEMDQGNTVVLAPTGRSSGRFTQLLAALERIAAIENKEFGPDWEEIDEAREIARAALSAAKGET